MNTSKLRVPGWVLLIGAPVALLVALLFLGGQTSKILSTVGSSINSGGGSTGSGTSGGGTVGDGTGGVPAAGGGATGFSADIVDVSRNDLLVIKTGTLSLQVASIGNAISEAGRSIAALGGYVSGSQQSGEGDRVTAAVTYRVPAARWEDALAAARSVAVKVVEEKTQTDDVTAKVVDLGARIANLQATERALQLIMNRATKVADVLAVQAQLTTVRGDIEQAAAEKAHLAEQAAYSTLTLAFSLPPKPPVVAAAPKAKGFDAGAEVDRATARLVSNLQHVEAAGIWFGIVWLPFLVPFGILAIAALFLLRRAMRWFETGSIGGSGPPPPDAAAAPHAG